MYRLINTTDNTVVAFFPAEDHDNAAVLAQALVKGIRTWAKKQGQAVPKKDDFVLRAKAKANKNWSTIWDCDPRSPSEALRQARHIAVVNRLPMPKT